MSRRKQRHAHLHSNHGFCSVVLSPWSVLVLLRCVGYSIGTIQTGASAWPRLVHGFNSWLHGKQETTRKDPRGYLWFTPEVDSNEPFTIGFTNLNSLQNNRVLISRRIVRTYKIKLASFYQHWKGKITLELQQSCSRHECFGDWVHAV